MNRYLTTSEARQKFLSLVDEVEDGDQVIITKRGVPKAAIVNFEELQTLQAVARLWQDPEALRAMRSALDDESGGQVCSWLIHKGFRIFQAASTLTFSFSPP